MFTLNNRTTGEATNLYFESSVTIGGNNKLAMARKITRWVAENLGQFELNEPQSCKVEYMEAQRSPVIVITGDEDSVELTVVHLINDNVITV